MQNAETEQDRMDVAPERSQKNQNETSLSREEK